MHVMKVTSDKEKIEAFNDYLVCGSAAEKWYTALDRRVVTTWKAFETKFQQQWPPQPCLYTTTSCQMDGLLARTYATVSCQTDEPPQHIDTSTDAPPPCTYTTSWCQTDTPPQCMDIDTDTPSTFTPNTSPSQMAPMDTLHCTNPPAHTAPTSQDAHGDIPPLHAECLSRGHTRRKCHTQSLQPPPTEVPTDIKSPRRTTSNPPYLRPANSPIQDTT
jgi:hypothetical protein